MPGTALVHDWILNLGGAERCLANLYELYPSDLFTLAAVPASVQALGIDPVRVRTSFLNHWPWFHAHYRLYLPFFPLAVERFDLSGYELVISSSHAVAKGVLTHSDQLHICYCYTPMRYAWELQEQYLDDMRLSTGMAGGVARLILHYLRVWDSAAAPRVDHFVAVSRHVARRIKRSYGRDSTVIYPPVDLDQFEVGPSKDNFYLLVSRMVRYKKVGLVLEAFAALPDRKLVVIGQGPDFRALKEKVPRNVEFLGYQPFPSLKEYLRKARAVLIPAEEDFSLASVEAQACGTPVIAFGKGGVLETVTEGKSGVFFEAQTPDSVKEAVERFERLPSLLPPEEIRRGVELFSRKRFQEEFRAFVTRKLDAFHATC